MSWFFLADVFQELLYLLYENFCLLLASFKHVTHTEREDPSWTETCLDIFLSCPCKGSSTDPVDGSMMQPPSRGSFWQEQCRSAVSWLIPRL